MLQVAINTMTTKKDSYRMKVDSTIEVLQEVCGGEMPERIE